MGEHKEKYKKILFPIIMTVFSGVFAVVAFIFIAFQTVIPDYKYCLLFAVPFLTFGFAAIVGAKGEIGRSVANLLAVFLLFLMPFYLFIVLFTYTLHEADNTVQDVSKYQRTMRLSDYGNNEEINHFPKEIPKDSKNVQFLYQIPFLQGGEEYLLKEDTNPINIIDVVNRYKDTAQWYGPGSDEILDQHGIFSTSFSEVGIESISEDYVVYVLDSKPYHKGDWNHGYSYGFAVNAGTNTIVYFSNDW